MARGFNEYFYPEIEKHPDLYESVKPIVEKLNLQQNCVIHGDFHFENVVGKNGEYKVIDWTNGQLGDKRYDFAWSSLLINVYGGQGYSAVFCSEYLKVIPLNDDEIKLAEALACIRWVLLNRSDQVPIRDATIKRVKHIMCTNGYLGSVRL
ncbi:phosphotransferase [Virgibacillus sp. DJP39]|uniref:phosphotransferase family protein n=1 Tax=Virgibacillus sp. DJP39 TaxID=3409790 RepID=UPI003BB75B91